jgi:TonB-dependent SusC/RagA subfamily outer membrane receptor
VLLALAPLFAIAMPWNVALWWQLRRLRLSIEVDCDRRVLAHGIAPGAYGTLLLDIARRGGAALVGAAALAEPRTFLERRILAMSSTIPTLRLPRAIALSAAATVFALAACEATTPLNVGTPEPRAPETETVVASPELPLEVEQERVAGDPLIVIDGVIVERKLDALTDPNTIERIEVLKGAAAAALYGPRGENGVIQIFTKQAAGEVERRAVVEQMLSGRIRLRQVEPEQEVARVEKAAVAEKRAKVALLEKQRSTGVEETVRGEVERQKVLVEQARENTGIIKLRQRAPERDVTRDPVIMIDDVVVDGVDLDRLPPDRIERIEVVKGMAAAALGITDGRGLIRIYMKR